MYFLINNFKTLMTNQNQECCPKFDPTLWDNKTFEWDNKKFIKDKVFTLFYMPMNFGSVIKRMMAKIEKSGAKAEDWMGLSDHTSKWNMDLYVAVDKEVESAENTTLSGKFLSKVYEGNFKDTGSWMKDFNNYAKEKEVEVKKMYMWYTTCPKCAKKYGKNYVVIIGEIK
jgi:hypothetical protein